MKERHKIVVFGGMTHDVKQGDLELSIMEFHIKLVLMIS